MTLAHFLLLPNFHHHKVRTRESENNKCDLNHHDHSNAVLATYSYISPLHINPSLISIQEANECSSRFNSYPKRNTSCTFSVSLSLGAQIFIESWKIVFKNETIKTAAYLPKAIFFIPIFSGRQKRNCILHIFEIWSLRCESQHSCLRMWRKAIMFSALFLWGRDFQVSIDFDAPNVAYVNRGEIDFLSHRKQNFSVRWRFKDLFEKKGSDRQMGALGKQQQQQKATNRYRSTRFGKEKKT